MKKLMIGLLMLFNVSTFYATDSAFTTNSINRAPIKQVISYLAAGITIGALDGIGTALYEHSYCKGRINYFSWLAFFLGQSGVHAAAWKILGHTFSNEQSAENKAQLLDKQLSASLASSWISYLYIKRYLNTYYYHYPTSLFR